MANQDKQKETVSERKARLEKEREDRKNRSIAIRLKTLEEGRDKALNELELLTEFIYGALSGSPDPAYRESVDHVTRRVIKIRQNLGAKWKTGAGGFLDD